MNFKLLAKDLPVQPLLDAIDPELWKIITTRQDYPGSAHHDTECIFLRWCRDQSLQAAFRDLDCEWMYPAEFLGLTPGPLLNAYLAPIVSHFYGEAMFKPFELGRIILTNLHAGGVIDAHTDEGAYAEHFQRFHLALQSDDGNEFFVGGESFQARPGELWWFDHRKDHEVINDSARDRLHLIVDARPC